MVVIVRPLQARGVIFWQCNNALTAHANRFVREMHLDPKQVREELIAGLNPGVTLVPAHTMVLGLAQERGFAYEQIGWAGWPASAVCNGDALSSRPQYFQRCSACARSLNKGWRGAKRLPRRHRRSLQERQSEDAPMMSRRSCNRFVLLVTVVVGSTAIQGCGTVNRALKAEEAPTSQARSADACSQQESAARAAALDALHAASPATSPESAMAASMAKSRAAIAESEYRDCLARH